jgi:hypothetical protein
MNQTLNGHRLLRGNSTVGGLKVGPSSTNIERLGFEVIEWHSHLSVSTYIGIYRLSGILSRRSINRLGCDMIPTR